MAKQSRSLALQHGENLPRFANPKEAANYYFDFRDKHLALLSEAAPKYPSFQPDYSAESLKQLERWYFHLYETDSFHAAGIDRATIETCMAMYFGETTVCSAQAQWIVDPYFLAPNNYELGVRKGSFTMMLSRFTDHFRKANNKKRESLFRRYKRYFAPDTQPDLDSELKALLQQNKVISAVALYQQRKQCALDEAKRYIESL